MHNKDDYLFPIKEKFYLSDKFLEQFKGKQPDWGPIGYIVYKRSYARDIPEEGRTEEFWETLKRVVEGCYTIQLNHCKSLRLPWNAHKSQKSAQRMYQLMWEFKFLPPGRMLWTLGTEIVWMRGSSNLLNCAYVSSADIKYDFSGPFAWVFDVSMYGVGCGFDTKGAGLVKIQEPKIGEYTFVVPDTREGWCELVTTILDSYVGKTKYPKKIDYSEIRPNGAPIKTFGGIAPGPEPLKVCISEINKVLKNRIDEYITSTDIVDLMNIIGKCVVSGGVRRSALLSLGEPTDKEYLEIKDPEKYPEELQAWRWSSNNSVIAYPGMDYDELAKQTAKNGEPGFVYLDNIRKYGRLKDGVTWADINAAGVNPCLSGDTMIATADGRDHVRIDEIEDGTPVYCLDDDGNVVIRKMMNPRITGYNKPIYKMTLDDGMVIRATDNHKFRMKDGTYKQLKDLRSGDSLDVLTKYIPDFRSESRGDQYKSFSYKARSLWEHIEIAKFTYNLNDLSKKHIHHIDGNKLNNSPENLEIIDEINHLTDHSVGENNPNYSGITNEKLISIGIELCKKLGRRFSTEEWQEYALNNNLPSQFSEYRISSLGKVDEFSKKCAVFAGVDEFNELDPRTTRFYQEVYESGYDTFIDNKQVYVRKNCEICGDIFVIDAKRREQCVCSTGCSNTVRDYSLNKEGQQKYHDEQRDIKKEQQVKILLDMKFNNNGNYPYRKEWEEECKKNNIPFRLGASGSTFKGFKELKEYASNYNHRIVSIELDGYEDVWNGTVEEYHNFFVGGQEGITKKGRKKYSYINSLNCGELLATYA